MLGLVDPGDEVVVCEPYYDTLPRDDPVRRRRTTPGDPARPGLPARRRRAGRAVTDRTKLILLNTPAQPDGQGASTAASSPAVAEVAQRHDLVVVTDEVYEHLTFDEHGHVPIATLPGMFERTVHDLELRQDLLVHRVEDRLGDGPGRPGGGGRGGQELVVLLLRRALPARHRPGARRTRRPSTSSCARPAERRDFLCDALASLGLRRARPPGRPTSSPPTSRRSGGPTAWRSAPRWPIAPRSWRSRPGLLRGRIGRGPAPGPVGVLQGAATSSTRGSAGSDARPARLSAGSPDRRLVLAVAGAVDWTAVPGRVAGRAADRAAARTAGFAGEPGPRTPLNRPAMVSRAGDLVEQPTGNATGRAEQCGTGAGGQQVARPVVAAPGEPGQHERTDATMPGTSGTPSQSTAQRVRSGRPASRQAGESTIRSTDRLALDQERPPSDERRAARRCR